MGAHQAVLTNCHLHNVKQILFIQYTGSAKTDTWPHEKKTLMKQSPGNLLDLQVSHQSLSGLMCKQPTYLPRSSQTSFK